MIVVRIPIAVRVGLFAVAGLVTGWVFAVIYGAIVTGDPFASCTGGPANSFPIALWSGAVLWVAGMVSVAYTRRALVTFVCFAAGYASLLLALWGITELAWSGTMTCTGD